MLIVYNNIFMHTKSFQVNGPSFSKYMPVSENIGFFYDLKKHAKRSGFSLYMIKSIHGPSHLNQNLVTDYILLLLNIHVHTELSCVRIYD